MSKPSRRRQGRPGSTPTGATPRPPATPPATGPTSSASSTDETVSKTSTGPGPSSGTTSRASGTPRPSTGPTGTARTGRRTRSTYYQRSFAERHRGTIIGIAAIAGVALIGVFFIYSASRPLFQCTNIWEPTPTASPLPGASPAPGYVQDDMGRLHVPPGEVVKYTYCPPASGNHYFAAGLGPIPARFYGVNDKTIPQGWIHNLEHGALVLLYRGDSEGATPAGQQALRAFFDAFPNSPVCNITPGTSQGPVVTRFDEMATPFAALVWGRVLPLQTLDTAAILDFWNDLGRADEPGAAVRGADPDAERQPVGVAERESAAARPRRARVASGSARAHRPRRAHRRRPVQRPRRAPAPRPRRAPARADRRRATADPIRHRRVPYGTQMLALVKAGPGPGLVLTEVPEPVIGINDVLIRVQKTGICGTDLHIESWDPWAQTAIHPPLVVGHEFVGDIVAVGANVVDFHPGDLVSGEGHVVCGRCRHCLAGRRHLCANTIGLGVGRDGAFAEYVALPMTNIWHHWPGVDPEIAAIFDPFGNAVHTALAFPILGEDVLISGAGPIGLMATAVVRHAGARHVVVSEPNAYRRELALRMGATIAVDPGERDLREVGAGLGMVEGFDVALEMSGSASALRARDRRPWPTAAASPSSDCRPARCRSTSTRSSSRC